MKKIMVAMGLAVAAGILILPVPSSADGGTAAARAASMRATLDAGKADVGNVVAEAAVPAPPAPTATTPTVPPRAAAAVKAPAPIVKAPAPLTVRDLTNPTATNAPLVSGHWTQATNGALYRDPSPGIVENPVGATDPAYEQSLVEQLCMPGKPEFC